MTDEEIVKEFHRLEREIEELKRAARQRELEQWKWGVRVLGTMFIVLMGWVWSQIGHLFDLGATK